MNLSELVRTQITADRKRGFEVKFVNERDRVTQIEKDLIGLIGEVGEFANIVKKIRLNIDHDDYVGPDLEEAQERLREEMADAFIYLMRISTLLDCDLEEETIKKMKTNDRRYRRLEL